MNLLIHKKRQIFILTIILSGFFTNLYLYSFLNCQITDFKPKDLSENDKLEKFDLQTQALSSNNEFSGIGGAWNTTHWANRTDYNLAASFGNNSYDLVEIPLGIDWTGYKLNATIVNLYDSRNWNNGTFNFGDDDGTYAAGEDDTNDITNSYQNWTFYDSDLSTNNDMSGNYLDSAYSPSGGQNTLELRMDGNPNVLSGYYNYNENDRCWWNSTFLIPRGTVIDSELRFELNPKHLANFNSWDFGISLNNIQVYSIGTYSLKKLGADTWHSFRIPQSVWINQSNVYTTPVNNTPISVEFSLEYVATTASYSQGFPNISYQQLFVDNLRLITKAETTPSNILLKMNSTSVNDLGWGIGTAEIEGSWIGNKVYANFSSDDTWDLSSFTVDLETNLNLFAIKDIPETNYETNFASEGTSFNVMNNSAVNWLSYAYFAVPTGYVESKMRLEFPLDFNITWVSEPQQPSTNRLTLCDNSTLGILEIPIETISTTPDGFWKFEAISPNYCEGLTILKNTTTIPTGDDWTEDNNFLSGDYINITAKINSNAIVSSYISQTKASLSMRFPNGTIWSSKSQVKNCETDGTVYFDYFQIPKSPPEYKAGTYEAIITWNNSYSGFGLNETGIIYKSFNVIHDAKLEPDQGIYFIENVIDDRVINIKVSFNDKIDNTAIENALVYTNYSGSIEIFGEISPGFYLLEFNASNANAGNNTLTIFANSSFYLNKVINITVDVVKQTLITVNTEFLSVPWKQNFTLQFNYTEKVNTSKGISTTSISTNWAGETYIVETIEGQYSITCNTSAYLANTLQSLIINVDAYKYEAQSILIRIQITELGSNLKLYLNNSLVQLNEKITIELFEHINVTVKYEDSLTFNHLSGANVSITGGGVAANLTEDFVYNQYTIILNGTDIGQTIDSLSIFAKKVNYDLQIFPFIVEVTERKTEIQVFLNDVNKTIDPVEEVPIGKVLNITIKYIDKLGLPIENGIVQLIGEGLNRNFTENLILKQYTILVNTTEDLDIGVKLLTVLAQGLNYQTKSINLRITVRRINTSISTVSGDPTFIINPSQQLKLQIVLNDLDFGGNVKGASVTYRAEFGQGSLTDSNNDGIYEVSLKDIPVGSYIITINAFAGDNYDFNSYEIYLTVSRTTETTLPFLILLIILAGVIVGLGSYLYAYQKVLKYPKPVRKVKKYQKTLNKKKKPDVGIIVREKAFNNAYQEELSKSSKFLKGTPTNGKILKEKLLGSQELGNQTKP